MKNIIGFILKPDAISKEVVNLFEKTIMENDYEIIGFKDKNLTAAEINELHCVLGAWKYGSEEYIKYMQSGMTKGYLVKHRCLFGNELYHYSKNIRGNAREAYNCNPDSIRGKIASILDNKIPYKNQVHVTDNEEELLSLPPQKVIITDPFQLNAECASWL